MRPLSLTLRGFRGIRDGLGRDVLELDFEQLAGDAQLVAIAGRNGRGKTTLMDNMTPFPVMPSRAGIDALGSFSYYDHVFLPESVKDLVWEHESERYRSQLVFRLNGRKKTEAFLHVRRDEAWQPVRLDDGTVSDGRVETYVACVEDLLGSAETFFTSVFAAQGRRPLSAYRNAEIKTLLADLLALDEIRELGAKAAETTKLVRTGLAALREERATLGSEADRTATQLAKLGDTNGTTAAAERARAAAQQSLDQARAEVAQVSAIRDAAQQAESHRRELMSERRTVIEAGHARVAALDAQDRRERERLEALERRIRGRVDECNRRRTALSEQRARLEATLALTETIERAAKRLPCAEAVLGRRQERVTELRDRAARLDRLKSQSALARERVAGIERDAGQAALRVQDLTRRFGLTAEVPCSGTDLQGRCKLLADAREAQRVRPSAEAQLARFHKEWTDAELKLRDVEARRDVLAGAHAQLRCAETRLARSRERAATLAIRAARRGELRQARQALADVARQLESLPLQEAKDNTDQDGERLAISAARQTLAAQRAAEVQRQGEALRRLEAALAGLPPPFDASRLEASERAVKRAQDALAAAEAMYLTAVRDHEGGELIRVRRAEIADRLTRVERRVRRIEGELGTWMLLAKGLGNDGLIALSIDDAGPTLSALANDLLVACYGPRFTVSLQTLVQTAKGEAREGFDIVVHDAESGDSKSVTQMSTGERVWINESLTRAIALYLARNSGRRYQTLFSDEADGALDPERKRMFMAMKREALRIGGYAQEFFVSQTPELAAMADALIDLEDLAQ